MMDEDDYDMFAATVDPDVVRSALPNLCVGMPCPSPVFVKTGEDVINGKRVPTYGVVGTDVLVLMEAKYRRGIPPIAPVIFVEVEEDGVESLGNPDTFAREMGLPLGEAPTLEEAEAWSADLNRRWGRWEW